MLYLWHEIDSKFIGKSEYRMYYFWNKESPEPLLKEGTSSAQKHKIIPLLMKPHTQIDFLRERNSAYF